MKYFVFLICALLSADIAGFSLLPCGRLYPDFPGNERPAHTDAAAVLFHDFANTRTGIDDETLRRLNHGLELFRHGVADYLIVSGGNRPQLGLRGSLRMAAYAMNAGIPHERLLVEDRSFDSFSNLDGIFATMKRTGLQSLTLVSSPYHLKRIEELLLRQDTPDISFSPYSPCTTSPGITRFDPWISAHYNLAAYLLESILPKAAYRSFVDWLRAQ